MGEYDGEVGDAWPYAGEVGEYAGDVGAKDGLAGENPGDVVKRGLVMPIPGDVGE